MTAIGAIAGTRPATNPRTAEQVHTHVTAERTRPLPRVLVDLNPDGHTLVAARTGSHCPRVAVVTAAGVSTHTYGGDEHTTYVLRTNLGTLLASAGSTLHVLPDEAPTPATLTGEQVQELETAADQAWLRYSTDPTDANLNAWRQADDIHTAAIRFPEAVAAKLAAGLPVR